MISGSKQKFVVRAKDPENKVVQYSLVNSEAKKQISITKSGVLEIPSTVTGEFNITIRATVLCGVFTDQKFTIEPLQCPCKEYCKWKGGNETGRNSTDIECVCPAGCTGER